MPHFAGRAARPQGAPRLCGTGPVERQATAHTLQSQAEGAADAAPSKPLKSDFTFFGLSNRAQRGALQAPQGMQGAECVPKNGLYDDKVEVTTHDNAIPA